MSSSDPVQIRSVTPPVQHAEGPHWDPKNGVLYYVDTFRATAHRLDPKSTLVTSQKFKDRNSIGTITPIKDRKNEFIVGADRHIYYFQWDGLKSNSGEVKELIKVEEDMPKNQFNDGKPDSDGNLWLGTLTRQDDLGVTPKGGNLYKIQINSAKSACKIQKKISNTSISNGIAWSKNNAHMFYIDSSTRCVEKYKFDKGSIANKQILFDLSKHPEIEGIPDGMTIDSDDNLWVALFGGHSIINIDSTSGKLLQTVNMPVKYITSACFGGPHLDTLYVTTSKLHLKENDVISQPNSGSVFAVNGLGVRGMPMYEVVLKE